MFSIENIKHSPLSFWSRQRREKNLSRMWDTVFMSYYVYILTNKSSTLYTGVTNNLERRLQEHADKLIPGFTAKYNLDKLIYFSEFGHVEEAKDLLKGSWNKFRDPSLIAQDDKKGICNVRYLWIIFRIY